jgi:hypothetical protein
LHLAEAGCGRPLLGLTDLLRNLGPLHAFLQPAEGDEVGHVFALHGLHQCGDVGIAFHVLLLRGRLRIQLLVDGVGDLQELVLADVAGRKA